MNKYLIMFLCISFLQGNPAAAAIMETESDGIEGEIYITVMAERAEKKDEKATPKSNEDSNGDARSDSASPGGKTKKPIKNRFPMEDVELLARLVHAEANGEPYKGKVAVAATVLNRVNNPDYPDTIPEVVYQNNNGYQYCPVRNGEINKPADKESHKAVREALAGNDPTGGSLSFFYPVKSSNSLIRGRDFLVAIGNHIFVR